MKNRFSAIAQNAVTRISARPHTHRSPSRISLPISRIGRGSTFRAGTRRNSSPTNAAAWVSTSTANGTHRASANRKPPAAVPDSCPSAVRAEFSATAVGS